MYKYIIRIIGAVAVFLLGAQPAAYTQTGIWNPDYSIGTSTGTYNFSYTQTPSPLVEVYPAAIPNTGLTYQWYSSASPTTGFLPISGATATSYSPPALSATSVTTYYYRVTSSATAMPLNGVSTTSVTSNTIQINVVSVNWEDLNYIREHDVKVIGQSTWTGVDQLPIGSKLQTTSYLDGIGRPIEKISKQTATPATGSTTWGDQVQFSVYDEYNREPVKYLPYTTTNQPGVYKTTAVTDQAAYYANTATYNQSSPFTTTTFDNSPLNRPVNVKEPGTAWAASTGSSVNYDMNTAADSVQIWTTDYVQGDAPVNKGMYTVNTLFKLTYTDVNANEVIEFTDNNGRLILRKVQSTPTQAAGYGGWICTYSVYDDFGQLRFQIQPMGIQYLDANGWSFAGTNGATVLAEQIFQYNYDDKGHTIWKKAPGASGLNMIYDIRDRVVFTQDGNQATSLSTPQWTVNLYDALDRPVASVLFNTTETIANLQSDLAGAASTTSVSVTATANTGGATIPLTLSLCPVSINSTSLNSSTSTTVVKYGFYDNYTFPGVAAFNTSYTNLTAYSTSDPNVIPIAASQRALGMPTGGMVRVLGSTSTFLETTNYYDEKGRQIQFSEGNIRNGTDVSTLQYRWDRRVLSTCSSHTNSTGGYSAYITLTKYIFDNLGRVDSIQKQYGVNAMKTVSSYHYDDMGRLAEKNFDPAYSNVNSGSSGLESLNYTYNIHNQIAGINQDYALKNPADYNKWGHFFGEYLGYDNSLKSFAAAQLDGQVTGKIWSTQGDDVQRRYDYNYDNANRLVNAQYLETQTANSGWNHTLMNFKMVGHTGVATYDLNGNLLTMQQWGVIPGLTAPIAIDDLFYGYYAYSNRMSGITDGMTTTADNGLNGDFKNATNPTTPNYVYDNNGNEVIDPNKNIQSLNNGQVGTNGIHYNYLDKPDQIRLVGQGTIDIVYDADGDQLQRTFIPETTGGLSTVTTYIGDFVYQARGTLSLTAAIPYTTGTADTLDYINFEEGRVRVMTPNYASNGYDVVSEAGNLTLPQTTLSGVWDYFVRDYQNNVRMVLSEESHQAVNRCTMELDRAAAEDPVFGQSGAANEVETTRVPVPKGWTNDTVGSCSELGNIIGHNVGPNTLQKVMAGDLINTSVFYYFNAVSGNTNSNVVSNILSCLAGAMAMPATAGTLVGENITNIATNLGNSAAFTSLLDPANPPANTPQAYLTVLFFDERFNPVPASDGGVLQMQVKSTWTAGANLGVNNLQVPKNGYVYIYVSNLSDQSVYFDDLAVAITAGNIAEEEHYYPFGLKIASISSRRLGDADEGTIQNYYLYNDKELFEDGGLNWYDYGFRNYDPQIGRFAQMDPLADEYADLSPFQFTGNDPITNVDLDGMEPSDVVSFAKSLSEDANAVIKPITEGINAGGWEVSWSANFVSYAKIFKAAAPVVSNTTNIMSVATKIAATISNYIAHPPTGSANKWKAYLVTVAMAGAADATLHNNTFGIFGGDHSDRYTTDDEKMAYYEGEISGDVASLVTSTDEMAAGGGGLLTTGWTGVGGVISLGVMVHGAASAGLATSDIRSVVMKLYYYSKAANGVSDLPKSTLKNDDAGGDGQLHHIATDKHHSFWTPRLRKFFSRAGLNISTADENLVYVVDHQGPHPEEYHQEVYRRLLNATKKFKPGTAAYKEALIKALRKLAKECQTRGTKLNKLITK